MHGLLLSRFNSSAFPRVLRCFETTPEYHPALRRRFDLLNRNGMFAAGGRAELVPFLFDGRAVTPASVDLFLSSHVVEHLSDPCVWLSNVWRALRPGGLVFTQVPLQHGDPRRGQTRGVFHLLYFDEPSFSTMMVRQGFQQVASFVDILSNATSSSGGVVAANLNTLYRKKFKA